MPWRRGLVDRIAQLLRVNQRRALLFHAEHLEQVRAGHERTVELFCSRINQLEAELAGLREANRSLKEALGRFQEANRREPPGGTPP